MKLNKILSVCKINAAPLLNLTSVKWLTDEEFDESSQVLMRTHRDEKPQLILIAFFNVDWICVVALPGSYRAGYG